MAFISTFELLLKPQLPKDITSLDPDLSPLARNILQGYFLTIANVTNEPVSLSLLVTTITPGLEPGKILTRLDTTGKNDPVKIDFKVFDSEGNVKKSHFTFSLDANDTGLFILQPDATNKELREEANFELRGYVEVSINLESTSKTTQSTPKTTQLLITAEHRGTFFGTEKAELGEIAYALPLANGKALFDL